MFAAATPIEQEAAFWDTHDTTDFSTELQPVTLAAGIDLGEKLTLRLGKADRDALAERAHQMGIGPSTLVRIWIKEHLRAAG